MWQRPFRATVLVSLLVPFLGAPLPAQTREPTPIRQSDLTFETANQESLDLRDAARDDRWLGLGVRDVRWAPDGSVIYFRWRRRPSSSDIPEADPWFRADRSGEWVEEVAEGEEERIPADEVSWSLDGRRAAWSDDTGVHLFERGVEPAIRRVATLDEPPSDTRMAEDGAAIHFQAGEALYRYAIDEGTLAVVARRATVEDESVTDAARWLERQQRQLFEHIRREEDRRQRRQELELTEPGRPQALPVAARARVDGIQLSPDGRYVTFRARTPDPKRRTTRYLDYVDESGYADVQEARPKVGEPRDEMRLGIVRFDPSVPADSVEVTWVELAGAGGRRTVPHGPYWNLEGTRAVAQFISEDHEDLWFAELDMESGATSVIAHDHEDAWIGGPPIQANYLQPALLEWLPEDRFVFASERSGWSHLYRADPDGSVVALTAGEWEVRDAVLSRDRSFWLLQASLEDPAEDHLYIMTAAGGGLERLTERPGRHEGHPSPDGGRLAVVYGESVRMPDLYVRPLPGHPWDSSGDGATSQDPGRQAGRPGSESVDGEGDDADAGTPSRRITVSGADAYFEHPLVRPEIVSFAHPDGGPLWAALFRPERPNPERAAILHIHGGGYRQFAHRGWTVYGYALHLGLINYLVQQGYTVLDFDYRGSAGYGRDYRTDIAGAMGIKDTDGAAAAARYLVREEGIDSTRIGIYGVSYGGFLTLMAQFRYPGIFAAGIARAAVSDWAHYNDPWTSRILGVPYQDEEAYRRSSPIYYAEGLADHLLITHGLVDGNVQFQDAARLVQRLIELEKDFEVMYYPVEPHTIQTEASRYDYVRRAVTFFDRHLRGKP